MPGTVIHVITGLNAGGAERMLSRIVCHDHGPDAPDQIVVSLMGEGARAAPLRAAGIEVISLEMPRARPRLSALIRLIGVLREKRPAVVMTWLYHADLITTLAAPFAGNPPLVWNLRCADLDLAKHSAMTRGVVRLLARLSRIPFAVAANSVAGQRTHAALGYTPRRWVHLPNGFDVDVWRPDARDRAKVRRLLTLADDDIAVGLVARVDPEKDHVTFLNAAERVAARMGRIRFVLIGRDTETLALPPALRDRFTVMGERHDVDYLLRGLDIAVLCSHSEGFPNVVGEAMATGLPCIVTDVGDAADIVGDRRLVCPPRDPAALADALMELAQGGHQEIARRGAAARKRIADDYSLTQIAARYRTLLESAAGT